ncbi:MAG: glycosyltransferase family 1 protein [Aquabacterium sp.]|uniref:glycosyltransferase family 4 protein n=1 Tax=Aquabacterium sp. TaxID=1872578 RepID=UPI0027219E7A|nr:glycosyltransferase family 1 protein [Aquabacterium sp.]MDO9006022.1 glycosyltransferase family 1 protein [Aquabacterium sp.]
MNIGFDEQIFGLQSRGGISRYFAEIGRAMQTHGVRVMCAPGMHVNMHLARPGFKVSGLYVQSYHKALANKIRRGNAAYSDFYLRRAEIDVLHETYYRPDEGDRHAGLVPRVVTVHDLIHEIFAAEYSPNDKVAATMRAAVQRADHVICVSERTRQDLVDRFGTPVGKTSVVHHGISELDAFQVLLPPGPPFFLFVGNRQGYKNFESLLRAFAASPSLRRDLRLVAFGGGVAQTSEITLIQSLGLSVGQAAGNVAFVGGDDGILGAHMGAALAMVYPSRYEGFGMPPLEAMHMGCPVVCSKASVMPEVLGDAPYYVDPDDVDDIRRALEEVKDSSTLRADLIQRGRQRAGLYSWQRCADETLAVYRQVLGA